MVDLGASTTQDLKFTNFIPPPNLYILEKTFHLLNKKDHCPQQISECENLAHLFCHQIVRVYAWRRGLVCLQPRQGGSAHGLTLITAAPRDEQACSQLLLCGDTFGCCEAVPVSKKTNGTSEVIFYHRKCLLPIFWRLIFWGGEPRSLDDGSESLSSLLLLNLFPKERSSGIAAWPLKKPFLSIYLIKNRSGCGVSIACSMWETSSGWAWLSLAELNSFLCFPLQLPKPCHAFSNGKFNFIVSLI